MERQTGNAETSIAHTRADHGVRVTEAAGDGTQVLFDNDSREQEVVLRSNWRYRPRPGTALAWGVTARRLFGDFDLFDGPDRTRLDTRDEPLDVRALADGLARRAPSLPWSSRSVRVSRPHSGGRVDYFSLNARGRLVAAPSGCAYDLDPRTTLTAAAGIYRQTLPAWPPSRSTRTTAASTTSGPITPWPGCGGA